MDSTWVLVGLISIWLVFLLPMWFRSNSSPHMASTKNFSKAIATLRDNQPILDASGNAVQVQAKSSPRAGSRLSLRQRRLTARRRAFGAALMMIPSAFALQLLGNAVAVWALPVLAMALYVAYARRSISLDRQSAVGYAQASNSSLLAGLGAAGRAAAERLLQTEREFETEKTPSWQPAEDSAFGSPWQATEPVLPTYTKSAEVEKQTPARFWDGGAMIDAAKEQRAAELAALIADIKSQEIADEEMPTGEIPRVAGA
jgi:hypothetical protein